MFCLWCKEFTLSLRSPPLKWCKNSCYLQGYCGYKMTTLFAMIYQWRLCLSTGKPFANRVCTSQMYSLLVIVHWATSTDKDYWWSWLWPMSSPKDSSGLLVILVTPFVNNASALKRKWHLWCDDSQKQVCFLISGTCFSFRSHWIFQFPLSMSIGFDVANWLALRANPPKYHTGIAASRKGTSKTELMVKNLSSICGLGLTLFPELTLLLWGLIWHVENLCYLYLFNISHCSIFHTW